MITGIRRPGSDCCCCSCAAADNTRNSKWLPSKGGTLLGLSTETIKSIPRSGIRNVWARLSCNYINWKYHSAQITAGLSAEWVFVRNVNCSQMASTGPHGPAVVVVACLNFGQNSWLEKCKIIAVRLSFPLITWGLRLPSRGMPFYPHLFVRYRYDWSVFRNSAQLSSTLRLFFAFWVGQVECWPTAATCLDRVSHRASTKTKITIRCAREREKIRGIRDYRHVADWSRSNLHICTHISRVVERVEVRYLPVDNYLNM